MDRDHILAVDLGGTKLAVARFDSEGMMTGHSSLLLGKRTGKEVGTLMIDAIAQQLKIVEEEGAQIGAIGIAVPGIYHQDPGTVWAPNIPGWEQYPLRDELLEYLDRRKIKLKIDSDRACYILGEKWKGVARNCRHAIYLAVGTGIGAGIMIDGKVLRGSQDIAGAIGWMSLQETYLEPYKTYGCFEYHASGQGIAIHGGHDFQDTAAVFAAYNMNNPQACTIVEKAIKCWGQATANLVSLLNPEMIIFGGGVFGPAIRFIDRIYQEACQWAQPISIKQVQFLPSALGDVVALYGAAYLAKGEREEIHD